MAALERLSETREERENPGQGRGPEALSVYLMYLIQYIHTAMYEALLNAYVLTLRALYSCYRSSKGEIPFITPMLYFTEPALLHSTFFLQKETA